MTAKFAASCPDCPFTGEYRTEGLARRALRQHSCQWQRHLAEQAARGAARRAAVDHTPKSCNHKHPHQHGTRACYILDRCRCHPCTKANRDAESTRYRLKAYGRYNALIDATPAREHVQQLMAQGMGPKRISEVSGVAHGVISAIIYGKYRGNGKPAPQKRVTPKIADRLLAVQFEPAGSVIAPSDDSDRARRQARALVALGWSMSSLSPRIGFQPANFIKVLTTDRPMQWATVRKITKLYDQLSMTLPPATNQRERISVARSKKYARERGWLLPLDLEAEDQADEPIKAVLIDEQAIWRRLRGDKTVRLTKAEKLEAVRQWQALGRPLKELERMTHWNVFRYVRDDLRKAS